MAARREGLDDPANGPGAGRLLVAEPLLGAADLPPGTTGPVRVRFRNDGGKVYLRCEAHLTYRAAGSEATVVTFAWSDDAGEHRDSHRFAASAGPGGEPATWDIPTGRGVRTRWVEFRDVPAKPGD